MGFLPEEVLEMGTPRWLSALGGVVVGVLLAGIVSALIVAPPGSPHAEIKVSPDGRTAQVRQITVLEKQEFWIFTLMFGAAFALPCGYAGFQMGDKDAY
jgi:hypothetical protein